jgi:uncharacterized OsmC-like protein
MEYGIWNTEFRIQDNLGVRTMAGLKILHKVNGIDLDILEGTIDAVEQDPGLGVCRFMVTNKWTGGTQNRSTIKTFYAAKQDLVHEHPFDLGNDEPSLLAGDDQDANPVEQMLHALAGCVTTSLVSHAAVRGIHIDELESEIEGDLDVNGYLGLLDEVPRGFTNIRIKFKVKSDETNTERLKELAEFSPVYNTIINGSNVDIDVESM